ncbi:MAG TPA: ABC transporter permease [Bdellovibrionales bacterium]|nr:ABC transporter permease [Bdellovibrionales bacterium]
MLSYILRRLIFTIPIMFGITLITFILFNMLMGDPAVRFAGRHATQAQVESIRSELGLDRSLPEQYIFYVKQIVTFDFGRSWATKQKISTMISEGIGPTLSVTAPPFAMSIVFCIGLALFTSYFRGTVFDHGVVVTCLALLSVSSLVYIILLQYFLAYHLGAFPISGWDPSWIGRWEYLFLPWIILFVLTLGSNILVYRSVVLDETFQDYVRTARAKGLSSQKVFAKHVLKNAMIPIITIIVIEMPFLITGTFLIETFFSIPGLGGMIIKGLNESDFPVIKAMTVVISIAYMFFNILSDILYTVVDPRIKLG